MTEFSLQVSQNSDPKTVKERFGQKTVNFFTDIRDIYKGAALLHIVKLAFFEK
jgi:hypothetical protein